jgi:hypothetical protein
MSEDDWISRIRIRIFADSLMRIERSDRAADSTVTQASVEDRGHEPDTATVLEVLTGDDPRDAITAVAHGRQPVVYSNYTGRHSLAGKRLGVVRDFMIETTAKKDGCSG